MIAIINYGAGNTLSVVNMMRRLDHPYVLTDDPMTIFESEKVILPGVGHAGAAMNALRERQLIPILQQYNKPLLGICLGMQLLYDHSEEGDTSCLGLIAGDIKKFQAQNYKIPHMGWNTISPKSNRDIYQDININEYFYFVHSYYAPVTEDTNAVCDYIFPFAASVHKNNIYGTQFHPEKSGAAGQQMIQNFLNL